MIVLRKVLTYIKLTINYYKLSATNDYSPTSKFLGDIFLILSDIKHAMPNDRIINPIPANVTNTIGILNVHFTMPSELKNSDKSGLIIKQPIIMPTTVEIIIGRAN